MSQVFIELTQVSATTAPRDTPVSHFFAEVVELTSSVADQDTGSVVTKYSPQENIVTVINNGADTIWVNFGAAAAVGTGRPVPAQTVRDFGNVPTGVAIHVINDS